MRTRRYWAMGIEVMEGGVRNNCMQLMGVLMGFRIIARRVEKASALYYKLARGRLLSLLFHASFLRAWRMEQKKKKKDEAKGHHIVL